MQIYFVTIVENQINDIGKSVRVFIIAYQHWCVRHNADLFTRS